VLEGFYQKLDEQESTLQESYALVWKGDPKLQAFYRYLNPSVRTRYWGGGLPNAGLPGRAQGGKAGDYPTTDCRDHDQLRSIFDGVRKVPFVAFPNTSPQDLSSPGSKESLTFRQHLN